MQHKYWKQEQSANADYVKKYDETLYHFISACPILVKEQYVM
jgi:hypothetical protein